MRTNIEELRATTHVDFGFAYDRHAIFVLHAFARRERDTKMCEHCTLRRRKKAICDESNGFDRSVGHEVMAYG
jgi:hypothetical protein